MNRTINARRALELARQDCPHWDYESDGDAHGDCCYRLDDAKREYRAAKAAESKRASL